MCAKLIFTTADFRLTRRMKALLAIDIQIWMGEMDVHLPNDHSILVGPFSALLCEEACTIASSIREHAAGNESQESIRLALRCQALRPSDVSLAQLLILLNLCLAIFLPRHRRGHAAPHPLRTQPSFCYNAYIICSSSAQN